VQSREKGERRAARGIYYKNKLAGARRAPRGASGRAPKKNFQTPQPRRSICHPSSVAARLSLLIGERENEDPRFHAPHLSIASRFSIHASVRCSDSHECSVILSRSHSGWFLFAASFSFPRSFFRRRARNAQSSRMNSVTPPHDPNNPCIDLFQGHIGENPFDNGSWGKEHFQPSTVPWQLNPRGHGRPSVSASAPSYYASSLSRGSRETVAGATFLRRTNVLEF